MSVTKCTMKQIVVTSSKEMLCSFFLSHFQLATIILKFDEILLLTMTWKMRAFFTMSLMDGDLTQTRFSTIYTTYVMYRLVYENEHIRNNLPTLVSLIYTFLLIVKMHMISRLLLQHTFLSGHCWSAPSFSDYHYQFTSTTST